MIINLLSTQTERRIDEKRLMQNHMPVHQSHEFEFVHGPAVANWVQYVWMSDWSMPAKVLGHSQTYTTNNSVCYTVTVDFGC